jgi:hypothetical protein
MANNKRDCVKKAVIDAEAQEALDVIGPVLSVADPSVADLKNALELANKALKIIKSDPHHL